MLQAQTCVYGKNGLAVLGIHIFSCRRRHRWFRATCLSRCEWFIKKIKLSELYATLYNSLCRCLIPPLYTMFMPTTLCHIKYFVECFRWLLYAVLCCVIPMWGMFHTLLYAGFMFVFSSIQFFSITYSSCYCFSWFS